MGWEKLPVAQKECISSAFVLHFFNQQQMVLLRDKLITQDEKREKSTQNLQQNNFARQVEGFCISYFAALKEWFPLL